MATLTDRLTAAWNALPAPSRSALRRSGIPYVGSYLASYRARYGPDRFAGSLPALVDEYHRSAGPARDVLAWRFHDVLDSLVLPNGVRKTTWPRRHQHAVEAFLARADRPPDGTALRVLDLPCSSGAASLDTRALLERCYGIRAWVLADLCMEVRLDADRGCVYDAAGELLQVRTRRGFFAVHRPHAGGDAFSTLSALALLPFTVRSAYLRRRHRLRPEQPLVPLRLLHPDVEAEVKTGRFTAREMDVFRLDGAGEFDLVFSFNLLQRSYFTEPEIEQGLRSVTGVMAEGGFLLWGNTESFGIARKLDGRLQTLQQDGNW